MTTGKTIALTRWTSVGQVMSLLLNMLFRLVITFLPRSKHFLISWLQSPSAVILEAKKESLVIVSTVFQSTCHEMMDWMTWSLFSKCWVLSQLFHSPLLPSSRGSLVPLHFLPFKWYHLHIWGCWYFSQKSWLQPVLHPVRHFSWCTLHVSQISRVTIYSLDELFSKFGTSLLFHVRF